VALVFPYKICVRHVADTNCTKRNARIGGGGFPSNMHLAFNIVELHTALLMAKLIVAWTEGQQQHPYASGSSAVYVTRNVARRLVAFHEARSALFVSPAH